jgi:GT2 family glycosyltransferase
MIAAAPLNRIAVRVTRKRMKLLVVISNYRVAHLTIDCLGSIAEEIGRVPGTHVGVCENGTGDDSAERIQQAITANGWGSWCTLTAVSPNRGFTGGHNVILRPALGSTDPPQYALLLNADTIVRPNAFKALVDFMDENPKVGIATSRLEDPDGTPQRAAFRFHTPLSEFDRAVRFDALSRHLKHLVIGPSELETAGEAEWVAGASMIIRREVFRDIGLLDEGYFTYFEDIDFCLNARRAGWAIWYVPASRVVHLVSQTTGIGSKDAKRLPAYSFEARRRYFLKNYGGLYAALADAGLILGLTLGQIRSLLGKSNPWPPHYFYDCVRHSVFLTGFRLRNVQNPALASPNPAARK